MRWTLTLALYNLYLHESYSALSESITITNQDRLQWVACTTALDMKDTSKRLTVNDVEETNDGGQSIEDIIIFHYPLMNNEQAPGVAVKVRVMLKVSYATLIRIWLKRADIKLKSTFRLIRLSESS